MSRFLSKDLESLKAYVPGEQPQDMKYIKLNTNESPYSPSDGVLKAITSDDAEKLRLYSDPDGKDLKTVLSKQYGVNSENIVVGNGSDEILSFCFQAYKDNSKGFAFPDITYGFYPVFCNLYGALYEEIPLNENLEINVSDYVGINRNIVIANPNAPSGIFLDLSQIEKIVSSNPDNIVVVDEAYVDFGGKSAVNLTKKYKNLICVQTFSKSRSLAGARLGFAIADSELIADLERVRCSTNPYNVNRLTLLVGEAAVKDQAYYDANCKKIIDTREYVKKELTDLGFIYPDSKTNFIFAKKDGINGETLYKKLKDKGILIRHFNKDRISDYIRITVGTKADMEEFINTLKDILN